MLIVGIDCATNEKKVGLAFAEYGDKAIIKYAGLGNEKGSLVDTIVREIEGAGGALICIDAPLGWPECMGGTLDSHRAGEAINKDSNHLFRRECDIFIKEKINKQPLDVGADRIARTAHAALRILGELRNHLEAPIPLSWDAEHLEKIAAIEVYPAATLISHEMVSGGYKKTEQVSARNEIIVDLKEKIELDGWESKLEASADVLDAAICILSGIDFLKGNVYSPPNPERAKKEGWIWVKKISQ